MPPRSSAAPIELQMPIERAARNHQLSISDSGTRLSTDQTIDKILSHYRSSKTRLDPLAESHRLIRGGGPTEVKRLLQTLPLVWVDHAIASVYSVLMDGDRRKRLGAYFTPPPLVVRIPVNMISHSG